MIVPGRSIWSRRATVIVDTLRVSDLRVSFSVEKTVGSTPNKAAVKVYNLGPDQRAQLAQKGRVRVAIEAGYEALTFGLYLGELGIIRNEVSGPDVVTSIESADGERAVQSARVHRSFGGGTPVATVLGSLTDALGVGPGNALSALAGRVLGGTGGLGTYGSGTVVSGSASRELDRLAAAAGFEWSIQDGQIQILERGQAVQSEARVLSPTSGLIGSPTLAEEGRIKVKAALLPDLEPGRPLRVESALVSGWYRVDRVRYSGDTRGGEWSAEIEARPLA